MALVGQDASVAKRDDPAGIGGDVRLVGDQHDRDALGSVQLLEHLEDLADQFVRVRLTRIDNEDLNLFEFDYDLTMMVFFLNAEGRVYARYGGRDADSADKRQSLDGLHYTMASVLRMHDSEEKQFARRATDATKYVRDAMTMPRFGRCLHCHQVKEILDNDRKKKGQGSPDMIWRYPLPENLG